MTLVRNRIRRLAAAALASLGFVGLSIEPSSAGTVSGMYVHGGFSCQWGSGHYGTSIATEYGTKNVGGGTTPCWSTYACIYRSGGGSYCEPAGDVDAHMSGTAYNGTTQPCFGLFNCLGYWIADHAW